MRLCAKLAVQRSLCKLLEGTRLLLHPELLASLTSKNEVFIGSFLSQ